MPSASGFAALCGRWSRALAVLCAGIVLASGCGAAQSAAPSAAPPPAPRLPATESPWPTTRASAAPAPTRAPTSAPTRPPVVVAGTPTVAQLTPAERERLFLEIWRKINDNYLYPDFGGLDWQAVREQYAARVAAASDNATFYTLMIEMVALLGDGHSRFLAPSAAAVQDAISAGREADGEIGAVVAERPGAALIVQIIVESPAARGDLRPRDRIIAVDGEPFTPGVTRLNGPVGSSVRLTVVRPGEPPRDVELVRRLVEGSIGPTWARYPGGIGYIGIPTLWVDTMGMQVGEGLRALEAEGPLAGLILDLRGNGGGWRPVLTSILGHFVRGNVGTFVSRHERTALEIAPAPTLIARDVPLVVLIDSQTASYAELLAAILQAERGAMLVGEPTAGNTETIYSYELADGARLWVAQEGFQLRSGANLEGRGVVPDVTIDLDWTVFREEDDPYILEARRLLGAGPK